MTNSWMISVDQLNDSNDSNNTKYDQHNVSTSDGLKVIRRGKLCIMFFTADWAPLKWRIMHLWKGVSTFYTPSATQNIQRRKIDVINFLSSTQAIICCCCWHFLFSHTLSVHNHCLIIQCEKSHSLRYDTNAQEFQNKIEHVYAQRIEKMNRIV